MKIFISCLLLFMLGLCAGYGICSSVNKTPSNDNNSERRDTILASTTDSLSTGTDSSDLASEAKSFLNSVITALGNKDVSFDKIHRMYSIYKASFEAYSSYDEDNKVYYKLDAYNELVKHLENGELEAAKQLAGKNYISKQHADKVRILNENNYKVSSFAEIIGQSASSDSGAPDQKITCPICKSQVGKSQLEDHNLTLHPYICPESECKQRFTTQDDLTKHSLETGHAR